MNRDMIWDPDEKHEPDPLKQAQAAIQFTGQQLVIPPLKAGMAYNVVNKSSGPMTVRSRDRVFTLGPGESYTLFGPAARFVMEALGGWSLPKGQDIELNRDDYTRLPLDKRALSYKTLYEIGALSAEEIRALERYNGGPWTQALTGAQITPDAPAPPRPPDGPPPAVTSSPSPSGSSTNGQRHPAAGSTRRPGLGGSAR